MDTVRSVDGEGLSILEKMMAETEENALRASEHLARDRCSQAWASFVCSLLPVTQRKASSAQVPVDPSILNSHNVFSDADEARIGSSNMLGNDGECDYTYRFDGIIYLGDNQSSRGQPFKRIPRLEPVRPDSHQLKA
jgi:hypothetical protein